MDYKILIINGVAVELENLSNFLKENFTVEILKSSNIKDGLQIARVSLPHLIILDLDLPKQKGFQFLEILDADVVTKDIPVAIMSDSAESVIKSNLLLYDVRGFLNRDFNKQSLIKIVKETLSKESKFSGSYTNRFIKSFISFNSSQSIASKMMAIVDAISYKIQIPIQKKMDIKATLAILSTTIKSDNLSKVIKLYKDMHFANDILNLLENFQKPRDIYEEIIFIIYKLKVEKHLKEPILESEFENIDKDMSILIKKIINENLISVRTGLDFEMVWERLTDILMNESNIDFELADYFIHYVKEILVKLMINTPSYDMKIINEELKVKCVIDAPNISIKDIHYISKYKDITLTQDSENTILITLNKITKSVHQIDSKEKLLLDGENFVVMSANEYLDSLGIDFQEDLEIMIDIEKDLDTNLIFLENNNFATDEFEDVADLIFSYAERIDNTFYEFEAIGYALKSLGELLFNINNYNLPADELKKVHIFLWQLKEDLVKWRTNVFIERNVENIHYLDASFFSSCMQIKSIITKEEIASQDEDDIFF